MSDNYVVLAMMPSNATAAQLTLVTDRLAGASVDASCEDGRVNENPDVEIRPYRSEDARATLAVFIDAVTVTAAADYSTEQIAAWARPAQRNESDWDRAMKGRNSYVCVVDDAIAGFSDVSPTGYIDMMFVSPRHARRGLASALLALLEAEARATGAIALSADVSLTARPFFERHGFIVEAEQHPMTAGVPMTNFQMTRPLAASNSGVLDRSAGDGLGA
ncbi:MULTISPECIES: GNAT family N-acetyltransferase [unclassified Microbacterium]|uniref:GNAT family N-acetyltransferase n=1 Tax=unclassified Microbacterium TaxID=2609290 RepID=UPI00215733D6|nr:MULTISPECIES: GNAT family N-acetyltransferase [unclassified Microbacterium]